MHYTAVTEACGVFPITRKKGFIIMACFMHVHVSSTMQCNILVGLFTNIVYSVYSIWCAYRYIHMYMHLGLPQGTGQDWMGQT